MTERDLLNVFAVYVGQGDAETIEALMDSESHASKIAEWINSMSQKKTDPCQIPGVEDAAYWDGRIEDDWQWEEELRAMENLGNDEPQFIGHWNNYARRHGRRVRIALTACVVLVICLGVIVTLRSRQVKALAAQLAVAQQDAQGAKAERDQIARAGLWKVLKDEHGKFRVEKQPKEVRHAAYRQMHLQAEELSRDGRVNEAMRQHERALEIERADEATATFPTKSMISSVDAREFCHREENVLLGKYYPYRTQHASELDHAGIERIAEATDELRSKKDFLQGEDREKAGHLLNSFGWFLATGYNHRHPTVVTWALRNARTAQELFPPDEQFLALDTEAAAYALGGDFKQAIETQQAALNGAPDWARSPLLYRLALYRAGKIYHRSRLKEQRREWLWEAELKVASTEE